MKILIKPSDIVELALWDNFTYYVVGSEKDAEALLIENKEFELSEKNALIIGLLKVINTDNMIHRFNDYLTHFLTVKSIKSDGDIYVKKKSIELCIEKFLSKFPSYWKAPLNYKQGLIDLNKYIAEVQAKLAKLEIEKITIQNLVHEVYLSNSIKKSLNFNNY